MVGISLVVLLIFATTSLTVAAVGWTALELAARRAPAVDPAQLDPRRPTSPWGGGWLDRGLWRLLDEAGSPLTPATLVALMLGLAVVGCAAPLVLAENFVAAALGTVVGAALPPAVLAVIRLRRFARLRQQLPEALDVLADAVRSGRNLEQASEEVARQNLTPLSAEFADAAAQLRLGQVPGRVLERLVARVPLAEMRVFAAAAAVHRQTGGNLSLLVERLSQAARDRLAFNGHLRSVTAGSRFSALGLVVATIVAVGLLSYLQPNYLQLFWEHPWGRSLIVTAAALQLAGIVWVSRVLKIDF